MSTTVVALPDIPDERPGVARLTWIMVALGATLAPHALHLPLEFLETGWHGVLRGGRHGDECY